MGKNKLVRQYAKSNQIKSNSRGGYNTDSQIKCKTSILKRSLTSHYSDAYIM